MANNSKKSNDDNDQNVVEQEGASDQSDDQEQPSSPQNDQRARLLSLKDKLSKINATNSPAPESNDESETNDNGADKVDEEGVSDRQSNVPDVLTSIPSKKPSYSDYIKTLMGNSDDQMKAAQAKDNYMRDFALGGIGGTNAASMIIHQPVPNEYYKALLGQAGTNANQLAQQQAARNSTLQQSKAIMDMSSEAEKEDPESPVSQLGQNILTQLSGKMGFKVPDNLDQLSYSTIEKQLGPMERYATLAENAKSRQLTQQMMLENKRQQQEQKQAIDQAKAMADAGRQIEQAKSRGTVKNAYEAERLANNATDLINLYGGDPNKLNEQDVGLVKADLAKIATGGAATQSAMKEMGVDTFGAQARNFWQKVSGNPTPAQLGDFLKRNEKYLNKLKDNSQDVIGQNIHNVISSSEKKMGSDNAQELSSNPYYQPYLQKVKSKYAIQAPEAQEETPQYEQDVLNYAKTHNITPDQANAIKQSRQGQ